MVPKDAPKNSASNMSASKNSTWCLRPQSKIPNMVTFFNMSRCDISVKTKFKKNSFPLTLLGPAALEGLQGAKSVK